MSDNPDAVLTILARLEGRLETLNESQKALEQGQKTLEQGQKALEQGQKALERGQRDIMTRIDRLQDTVTSMQPTSQ